MDEKENKIGTAENAGEGSKPKATAKTIAANAASERMEKATEAQRIENDRAEELAADRALDGEASAGQEPQKPKEETNKEYRDRIEKEVSEGKHND